MEKGTTYVALDDSKRKIVAGILRPGGSAPELRGLPNDPPHIRRLFERLKREGPVAACYEAGVSGVRPLSTDHGARRVVSGDGPGVDPAAPRPAHQDRPPRCRQAGPPLSRGRADPDSCARRSRRSGPGFGALPRRRPARRPALAPSPAQVAGPPRATRSVGER